ncbi:RHOMBOID-like protein [Arachis hypogaea]|nr:RHOMBOID-like protein [Arachis hypogaea]
MAAEGGSDQFIDIVKLSPPAKFPAAFPQDLKVAPSLKRRRSGGDTLEEMGALGRNFLTEYHQTWRLFTSPFLHAGLFHLLLNLCSIIFIGIHLEHELGPSFSSMVDRKNEEMSTSELSGGARIHYIFQSIFVNNLEQAVTMQQMQFQQALLMQQTMTAQQAANKAATMKSATELAAAQAAEISKKLKADGPEIERKETKQKFS